MAAEARLQRAILDYLNQCPGVVARRTNSGMARSLGGAVIHLAPAGTPDITGHLPDGRALYIEVKDPAARDRKENRPQERFILEARAAGCVAFTARSVDEVAAVIIRETAGKKPKP